MKDDPILQLWRHNGTSGYPINVFSKLLKLLQGKKILLGCSIALVSSGQ